MISFLISFFIFWFIGFLFALAAWSAIGFLISIILTIPVIFNLRILPLTATYMAGLIISSGIALALFMSFQHFHAHPNAFFGGVIFPGIFAIAIPWQFFKVAATQIHDRILHLD